MKPWEPVAFFEMDNDPSITVDIDFQRSCRYIMLKPTGIRKKPTHFTQNINNVPMEIEFFGVTGTSFEDCSLSQGTENETIVQDMNLINALSYFEMEIRILNDTQIIKKIPSI